jgi:hypothetical protein
MRQAQSIQGQLAAKIDAIDFCSQLTLNTLSLPD